MQMWSRMRSPWREEDPQTCESSTAAQSFSFAPNQPWRTLLQKRGKCYGAVACFYVLRGHLAAVSALGCVDLATGLDFSD